MDYDKILGNIYSNIKKSKKLINSTCKFNVENGLVLETAKAESSRWLPSQIKSYMDITEYLLFKYSKNIDNRFDISISIYFEDEKNTLASIKKYIKLILVWYAFIVDYSTENCSKNISIILYLTDFKKILPESNVEVLGPNNVNTGYATRCANGNITIYRSEEWFKVLIHESMHYLGLDFSIENHDLKSVFPIDTDILLSECYAESWARILNVYFTSFYRKPNSKDEFMATCKKSMSIETKFSLVQCSKVLDFMGLSYEDLVGKEEINRIKRRLYKERSNVFSYYVLTCIIMQNPEKFVCWCANNNHNMIKIDPEVVNSRAFEKYIVDNHKILLKKKTPKKLTNQCEKNYPRNLRMTIIEF
tara:strand:- start:8748 stop:9830 length:1083 start_codon:yes stop_codon:yes gene_type:complete